MNAAGPQSPSRMRGSITDQSGEKGLAAFATSFACLLCTGCRLHHPYTQPHRTSRRDSLRALVKLYRRLWPYDVRRKRGRAHQARPYQDRLQRVPGAAHKVPREREGCVWATTAMHQVRTMGAGLPLHGHERARMAAGTDVMRKPIRQQRRSGRALASCRCAQLCADTRPCASRPRGCMRKSCSTASVQVAQPYCLFPAFSITKHGNQPFRRQCPKRKRQPLGLVPLFAQFRPHRRLWKIQPKHR